MLVLCGAYAGAQSPSAASVLAKHRALVGYGLLKGGRALFLKGKLTQTIQGQPLEWNLRAWQAGPRGRVEFTSTGPEPMRRVMIEEGDTVYLNVHQAGSDWRMQTRPSRPFSFGAPVLWELVNWPAEGPPAGVSLSLLPGQQVVHGVPCHVLKLAEAGQAQHCVLCIDEAGYLRRAELWQGQQLKGQMECQAFERTKQGLLYAAHVTATYKDINLMLERQIKKAKVLERLDERLMERS